MRRHDVIQASRAEQSAILLANRLGLLALARSPYIARSAEIHIRRPGEVAPVSLGTGCAKVVVGMYLRTALFQGSGPVLAYPKR